MLVRMSDVTRLLDAAAAGEPHAAAELLPLVYQELRQLAAARMAAERADHTLDATALVHEAYLRLAVDPHRSTMRARPPGLPRPGTRIVSRHPQRAPHTARPRAAGTT